MAAVDPKNACAERDSRPALRNQTRAARADFEKALSTAAEKRDAAIAACPKEGEGSPASACANPILARFKATRDGLASAFLQAATKAYTAVDDQNQHCNALIHTVYSRFLPKTNGMMRNLFDGERESVDALRRTATLAAGGTELCDASTAGL